MLHHGIMPQWTDLTYISGPVFFFISFSGTIKSCMKSGFRGVPNVDVLMDGLRFALY